MNESIPWGLLQKGADQLNVPLDTEALAKFQQYTALLESKNKQFNLTAITGPEDIIRKLYLDSISLLAPIAGACSLSVAELCELSNQAIDIGSGAGIPGIPLCIACPGFQLSLVEANRKKSTFLTQVIFNLDLQASVLNERAEILGQDSHYRERYALVFARAVAPLPALAELTIPFARPGGLIVLPKGPKAPKELEEAMPALELLGATIVDLETLNIPGIEETRKLILLRKRKETPSRFPRRPGIPQKRPLK